LLGDQGHDGLIEEAVEGMMTILEAEYHHAVRMTPGADVMLDYWSEKVQMGVVSNYFMPGTPRKLLDKFGIRRHMNFVLNSAEFGYKQPEK
jgi:FMN phosphatase YigB (HAD superfamily)